MQLIKTLISDAQVLEFLNAKYASPINNLNRIRGGEFSQTFSYQTESQILLIRFNSGNPDGFYKDQYAARNFKQADVPIPDILEIGQYQHYHFAISELVPGETIDRVDLEIKKAIVPQLFAALVKIFQIPTMGSGYGVWNYQTFQGQATTMSEWNQMEFHKTQLWQMIETSQPYFKAATLEKLFQKISALEHFAPQERYLLHGDFGSNNAISNNGKLTGILDWNESAYGDWVMDLCWLQFWEEKIDYLELFENYVTEKKLSLDLKNYQERCQLAMAQIALGNLEVLAESAREEDYQECFTRTKQFGLL